jgi:hypothetical protein
MSENLGTCCQVCRASSLVIYAQSLGLVPLLNKNYSKHLGVLLMCPACVDTHRHLKTRQGQGEA